jgi:hypothetical protein
MDVDVLHLAGIDALAADGIGLIGQPEFDPIRLGKRPVKLGRGGSARPNSDLESFAGRVQRPDSLGERARDRPRL